MKKLLIVLVAMLTGIAFANAQGVVRGSVKDKLSGETIIGATVTYAPGKGAVTDLDGNFRLELPNGKYNISVQYSGYQLFAKEVEITTDKDVFVEIQLQSNTIKEVEVVADVAISRTTPVAFSNVSAEKIKEQLGAQDLPMILNSTPGVYATQGGGGDGDARITIRGFNQRNVAVMVDGIPMNDMENGSVFWSNWFGLDNVTRTMQVQRGLGASKLAIPSVGGTINIITSGFDAKRSLVFKQEYGNNLTLRTVLSYTSGQLKGGWAITAAGSYKRTDGYVDGTWSRMWFGYLKIDKKLGNHMLSLSALGAPQQHGQRTFQQTIGTYSHALAKKLGWTDEQLAVFPERGIRYNQNWGNVTDDRDNVYRNDVMSERINFFFKPVISLRHSWQVNDKFFWSNILYASFGQGGGTALQITPSQTPQGNYNMQGIITNNATNEFNKYVYKGDTVQFASNFLRASMNNHQWYGLLSTFNYRPNNKWSISGGADLRTYKSEKYRRVFDFMGSDVVLGYSGPNQNNPTQVITSKKDKITYDFSGLVNWVGAFGLAEYKGGNWSAFLNASGSLTTYQRIDYFIADTANQKSPVRYFPGFTVKGGANYNVTEHSNIYVNTGYFTRAPRFSNVFTKTTGVGNDEAINAPNEKVMAGELGYNYVSRKFSANVNVYYTVWQNRPLDFAGTYTDPNSGDVFSYNIRGMNARHTGAEFDAAYKPLKNLMLEGMISYGDWVWTSENNVYITNDFGINLDTIHFDARDVKVSDAAQMTAALSARYEPIKKLYIKLQGNYFGKNYAAFDPVKLDGANARRQSWKIPDYWLMEVHLGYGFKVGKTLFDLRGSIFNVFNKVYITDALNNGSTTLGTGGFDAQSATVYVGMGRRFVTSLTITY